MNDYSINIAKKKIEKVIIGELYRKEIIDFSLFNKIVSKIDEEICKLENNILKFDDMKNIVVKVMI